MHTAEDTLALPKPPPWRWWLRLFWVLLLLYFGLALLGYYNLRRTAHLQGLADYYAQQHRIDRHLFRGLITQESAWDPLAVSSVGAAGLTQLMPATAQEVCRLTPLERFEPAKNLDCGARYLALLLRRFDSVPLALAAYNAGPTRVAQLGRIPKIPETQAYVTRVMNHRDSSVRETVLE